MTIEMRNSNAECPGSFTAASQSDLRTQDRAFCPECGRVVSVWFEDGKWHRRGHKVGAGMDQDELAQIGAGVRGAAISPDYDPSR